MLTKEDLQAISELINGAVSASEERMIAQIAASENRVMAYIESDVKKEIRQIADTQKEAAKIMGCSPDYLRELGIRGLTTCEQLARLFA